MKENENVSLNKIIEDLQAMEIDNLPPGGGIHSKLCMIEELLDELLPNRSKEEGRMLSNSMPVVPLSMIRQFASDGVGLEENEEVEGTP